MLKILVVDDSLIIRRNIARMLERMNHEVVAEAKNGNEAIVCFSKYNPDLMTMDITMPDMDGVEAVKGIKKKNADAKIIMVTSHGQEAMVIAAIKAGASGYVLKPVTAEKLSKAIQKIFPTGRAVGKEILSEDEDAIPHHNDNEDDWLQDLDHVEI